MLPRFLAETSQEDGVGAWSAVAAIASELRRFHSSGRDDAALKCSSSSISPIAVAVRHRLFR